MKKRFPVWIISHWEYTKSVLEEFGVPEDEIKRIGFCYMSAMEHGYKHGLTKDKEYTILGYET